MRSSLRGKVTKLRGLHERPQVNDPWRFAANLLRNKFIFTFYLLSDTKVVTATTIYFQCAVHDIMVSSPPLRPASSFLCPSQLKTSDLTFYLYSILCISLRRAHYLSTTLRPLHTSTAHGGQTSLPLGSLVIQFNSQPECWQPESQFSGHVLLGLDVEGRIAGRSIDNSNWKPGASPSPDELPAVSVRAIPRSQCSISTAGSRCDGCTEDRNPARYNSQGVIAATSVSARLRALSAAEGQMRRRAAGVSEMPGTWSELFIH